MHILRNLTPFQRLAIEAGIKEFLNKPYFNLCFVDDASKVLDIKVHGRDYESLRLLHCVRYSALGPELEIQVKEKALEILGLDPRIISVKAEEVNEFKMTDVTDINPVPDRPKKQGLLSWFK